MYLKLFPVSVDNTTHHTFNQSEVIRLRDMFREWEINESDLFGPYELLDFVLLDPYKESKSQKLPIIASKKINKLIMF
jgi:hypothetical protein